MPSRSTSCPPTKIRDDITGVDRTKESYQIPLNIVKDFSAHITQIINKTFDEIDDDQIEVKKNFAKSLEQAINLCPTGFNEHRESDGYKSLLDKYKRFFLSINQQVNGNFPARGAPFEPVVREVIFQNTENPTKIAADFISSNLKTFLHSELYPIYSYKPNTSLQDIDAEQIGETSLTR